MTAIVASVNIDYIRTWMTDSHVSITDISTLVIAMCSVFVAIWSVVWTRRHNMLSVKPLLSIVRVIDNNDGQKRGLYLRNHGLGPAIIESISIKIPRKNIEFKEYGDLSKIFDLYQLKKGDLGVYWLDLLPKDVCERFLWLESDGSNEKEEFKKLMFALVFTVEYSSFYGKKGKAKFKMQENVEQVSSGNGASRLD